MKRYRLVAHAEGDFRHIAGPVHARMAAGPSRFCLGFSRHRSDRRHMVAIVDQALHGENRHGHAPGRKGRSMPQIVGG